MVDVRNCDFNLIMDKTVKPEESFINFYVGECLEYESAISATHRMRIILDAKYKKSDPNKVMKGQCQQLNTEEHKMIMILSRKLEDLFDGTLGMWNTTPADLELKDYEKPVFS